MSRGQRGDEEFLFLAEGQPIKRKTYCTGSNACTDAPDYSKQLYSCRFWFDLSLDSKKAALSKAIFCFHSSPFWFHWSQQPIFLVQSESSLAELVRMKTADS